MSSAVYKYLPSGVCKAFPQMARIARARVYLPRPPIPEQLLNTTITIQELATIADLEAVLRLEKEVWGFQDADVTPLTLAVAMKAAGSVWLGAFNEDALVGFAFAFPSLEEGRIGFHSHTLAVHPSYDNHGLGFQLKLAQRQRVLARGISEVTWTFDPLRSRNA